MKIENFNVVKFKMSSRSAENKSKNQNVKEDLRTYPSLKHIDAARKFKLTLLALISV